ncbi:Outer membrane protein TolC [Porphyromonadaceae bacterium KH3R12]|uniref:TolC family protein n=1 Tax=Proteiniphilum saccharofermentans TaxID=1642647 RepID=UPI00089B4A7F|nr:TolC family protein [Proteiniphilum saccharofermentans]SDZ96990.1 Outer membrane protein TolC [Porphyromonadaceae bacterium KH3R12]
MRATKIGIVVMTICGLLRLSVTTAQETDDGILRVDLETAVQIALSENPLVKVADMEVAKKDYAKKSAYGALLPQIDLIGQYQYTLKRQTMYMDTDMSSLFGGGSVDPSQFTPEELEIVEVFGKMMTPSSDASEGIQFGRKNMWTGTVNVSLPLVVPSLWKNIQMSKVDLEMAVEQSRSSKIDLTHQVKKAFYSILLARDSYDLFRETYTTDSLNLVNIKNKFEQGIVAEYDVITADVRLKSIIPNILQSESMLKIAELQLKMLMGIDSELPVEIVGSLSDYEKWMFEAIVPSDNNLSENSDLRQFDLQADQANIALELQKIQRLPTLTSSFNYSYISQNNDFKFNTYRWDPYSVVGVTLSIPIFSGGQRHHNIKQSEIQLLQLQEQRHNLKRSLQLSVRNNVELINKSIEQVVAAESSVQQAKKGYEITQKRYETGAGTIVDLNAAALAVTNAELQYRNAIYDYLASRADLEKTLGYDINTIN